MKIYLIRHGKRGHGEEQDVLTEEGKDQANKISDFLKDKNIDEVICGVMKRAKDTAKPFLENFQGPVEFTNLVNEQSLGVLQGKTAQEFRDALNSSGLSEEEFRPINGENRKDALDRAKKFIEIIKTKEEEKNIAIFSHSGFISDFCCLILNESLENKVKYKISCGNFHVLEFNKNFNLNKIDLNISS